MRLPLPAAGIMPHIGRKNCKYVATTDDQLQLPRSYGRQIQENHFAPRIRYHSRQFIRQLLTRSLENRFIRPLRSCFVTFHQLDSKHIATQRGIIPKRIIPQQ